MTTRSFGNVRIVKEEGNSFAVSLPKKELLKNGIHAGDAVALKVDKKTHTVFLKKMDMKKLFAKEE